MRESVSQGQAVHELHDALEDEAGRLMREHVGHGYVYHRLCPIHTHTHTHRITSKTSPAEYIPEKEKLGGQEDAPYTLKRHDTLHVEAT